MKCSSYCSFKEFVLVNSLFHTYAVACEFWRALVYYLKKEPSVLP